MAILTIKSSNPNFSRIIQKNPASGLFTRSHKNGMLFGFFPNGNESFYTVYFKDASDEITYKRHPDEQFEYLNSSKYNDARFINDTIQEVFHAARESKGDSKELDIVYLNKLVVNICETEFKTIDIFQRYFKDIVISYEEISKNNYKLSFVSNCTLSYLLKVVNLFGIFATLNSPTYSYFTDDLIKKYVRIANDIDAPYFIRYLIRIRMCRSDNKFATFKEELERSSRYKITMTAGDTHDARIQWIKSNISCDKPIVDIGSGIDFRYLKIFAPKLMEKDLQYYAIERDPDAVARIRAGIKNRGLEDNVQLFESLEDFLQYNKDYPIGKVDVICTEVMEHNEFDEAKTLFRQIEKEVDYDKFLVTVPNSNFNQYYGLDGFRHDDHKWEATWENIIEMTSKWPKNIEKSPIINWVGDVVDDSPVTFGITYFK